MCKRSQWKSIGLATVLSLLSCSLRVRAQVDAAEPPRPEEHAHQHEASRFQIGADLVSGWERDAVSRFSPLGVGIPFNSESLLFNGGVRVIPATSVSARFPLSFGSHAGTASGATVAPGNVEVEGEWETALGEQTQLSLALGVAVPTAQDAPLFPGALGAEAAADHAGSNQVEVSRVNRASLLYAAKRARGFEDAALFEAGRLGLIPKVQLVHRVGAYALEGFLKLENLLLVQKDHGHGEHAYMGELVLGGFAGFELAHPFMIGARLWANFALDHLGESVWVAEPQARAQLGPVRLVLGSLLWFAAPLEESALTGLRLLAATQF